MVEDSEGEEDGTDADIRRWVEAEHMEAELAEEDADEEVRGGLDPLMVYDAEEAKRPLTKQRSCLMEFASDLWYYRFFVKSAGLSRFRPFSDFTGRSVPKHSAPNQTEGRLGRHPPVWGDAKLWWVWKFCGRRGKGVDAPA